MYMECDVDVSTHAHTITSYYTKFFVDSLTGIV